MQAILAIVLVVAIIGVVYLLYDNNRFVNRTSNDITKAIQRLDDENRASHSDIKVVNQEFAENMHKSVDKINQQSDTLNALYDRMLQLQKDTKSFAESSTNKIQDVRTTFDSAMASSNDDFKRNIVELSRKTTDNLNEIANELQTLTREVQASQKDVDALNSTLSGTVPVVLSALREGLQVSKNTLITIKSTVDNMRPQLDQIREMSDRLSQLESTTSTFNKSQFDDIMTTINAYKDVIPKAQSLDSKYASRVALEGLRATWETKAQKIRADIDVMTNTFDSVKNPKILATMDAAVRDLKAKLVEYNADIIKINKLSSQIGATNLAKYKDVLQYIPKIRKLLDQVGNVDLAPYANQLLSLPKVATLMEKIGKTDASNVSDTIGNVSKLPTIKEMKNTVDITVADSESLVRLTSSNTESLSKLTSVLSAGTSTVDALRASKLLCIDNICINKSELKALVDGPAQAPAPVPPPLGPAPAPGPAPAVESSKVIDKSYASNTKIFTNVKDIVYVPDAQLQFVLDLNSSKSESFPLESKALIVLDENMGTIKNPSDRAVRITVTANVFVTSQGNQNIKWYVRNANRNIKSDVFNGVGTTTSIIIAAGEAAMIHYAYDTRGEFNIYVPTSNNAAPAPYTFTVSASQAIADVVTIEEQDKGVVSGITISSDRYGVVTMAKNYLTYTSGKGLLFSFTDTTVSSGGVLNGVAASVVAANDGATTYYLSVGGGFMRWSSILLNTQDQSKWYVWNIYNSTKGNTFMLCQMSNLRSGTMSMTVGSATVGLSDGGGAPPNSSYFTGLSVMSPGVFKSDKTIARKQWKQGETSFAIGSVGGSGVYMYWWDDDLKSNTWPFPAAEPTRMYTILTGSTVYKNASKYVGLSTGGQYLYWDAGAVKKSNTFAAMDSRYAWLFAMQEDFTMSIRNAAAVEAGNNASLLAYGSENSNQQTLRMATTHSMFTVPPIHSAYLDTSLIA